MDFLSFAQTLEAQAYLYDFFQVVRRLECHHTSKPRVGEAAGLSGETVRFSQEPSVAFAPSTLSSFRAGAGETSSELSVLFFGLFGPNGPLPLHLTEYARDRLRHYDDPTFAAFCDLFHHRLLSLFYKSWAVSRATVSFDRPDDDRFSLYVGALFGLGLETVQDRDDFDDRSKRHFAGLLGCPSRHAEGLAGIVEEFFEVPTRIEEFVGERVELMEDSLCRLGGPPETCTLGVNAFVGSQVWDSQHKFRVVVGPLHRETFLRFLPGEPTLAQLEAVIRNYIGEELAWDLRLILCGDEVPQACLGETSRLGMSSWSGPLEGEASAELIIEPSHLGHF